VPSRTATVRSLWGLAWANVVLHAAGLILAWIGMRPGSPLVPLAERMAYLAGHPAGWTWGWATWMACSLLLVSYMTVLRTQTPGRSATGSLAVLLTAAGMPVDLLCDLVQIVYLPRAAGSPEVGFFFYLEGLAFTGGATVANGLYTTGILLMTWCLRGQISPLARWSGFGTAVAGYAMALAGLLPSPRLLEAATGPTILLYSLWTVLVARDLARLGPPRANPGRFALNSMP
jgi:hypothetical protein